MIVCDIVSKDKMEENQSIQSTRTNLLFIENLIIESNWITEKKDEITMNVWEEGAN